MNQKEILERLKGGLIVSCYAGPDFNEEMGKPETMVCVARSCIAGGAKAIRTNWENVAAVKAAVDVPVIGLKKIYKSGDMITGDFRITPTLREVEELLKAGADGVAVDGTIRERYDELTLEQFIRAVKKEFDAFVIADISTVEEGVAAWNFGADMVGTTLSGYTPYSKNPLPFGHLPSPEPDYEIIRELRDAGVSYIVAEGRITNGEKMRKALDAGAHSVVIGTSITEPRKIVKTILMDAGF
ncbi:MAG: putative N-acetylmannosamine-6-phosphate 2-epimerase [Lachnospiraceae bacterium]|jgi:N-acylglucosamine-6-phosphate 2-epimerase